MFVVLKWNDIVNVMRGLPVVVSALPWGIKYEEEIRESGVRPYMYVEKLEFPDRGAFNKDMIVTLTIVWDNQSIAAELEEIFQTIDNQILTNIDWCTPIRDWLSAEVSHIRQSYVSKPFRDDKNNLILSKDYVFTYIIQS